MKILIHTQYFWPENFLINDVAYELSKDNEISVLTGYPNYPSGKIFEGYSILKNKEEWHNDIRIIRTFIIPRGQGSKFNLIVNYISFLTSSFIKLLFLKNKNQYDLCFVYAPSPLIGLLSIYIFKNFYKFKIFLWLQDLWPEVINNKTKSFLVKKIITKVCKYIYKRSDKILIQSKAYESYLKDSMNIKKDNIHYVPNWSQTESRILYTGNDDSSSINIAYTGNIGRSQKLENLVEICSNLQNQNINFHIFGDGRFKKGLEKKIIKSNIKNIKIYNSLPVNELIMKIEKFDALLLMLAKEYSHTIPAKFQFYLSLGMPIIASIDGYLNQLINENNIGLASFSGDHKSFEKNLIKFTKLTFDEKKTIADNAYNLYENYFSKKIIINKIKKIIYEKNNY